MSEISYLTAEGAARMKKELEELKGPARDALSKRLRVAIQQGDLSENADYIAAKEEQGFLEGRILELESTLHNVVIIDEGEHSKDTIEIGSRITVQEDDFPADTYYLVGPKEADPEKGYISYESPIGKALLGHKVKDVVTFEAPAGSIKLKVVKIE